MEKKKKNYTFRIGGFIGFTSSFDRFDLSVNSHPAVYCVQRSCVNIININQRSLTLPFTVFFAEIILFLL